MYPIRTALITAALALGSTVALAPAASAEPSPAELCALATSSTVGKLQSSGALDGLEVQGIPAKDVPPALAATAARSKLNCGSVPKADPAKAKAAVCAQLTVSGLRAFASRLGASAESQGKITEKRVKNARTALECDKTGTPTTRAKPTPTNTPSNGAKPTATNGSSSTSTTKPSSGKGGTGRDLDCIDFPNQKAAQAQLDKDRSDPHNLDRDNDNIACEQGDLVIGGSNGGGSSSGGSSNGGSSTNYGSGAYTGGDYSQVGDVPVGAVATGGR